MAQIVGARAHEGDAIVDYEGKVFEDIQAEPGEKAYIFMHTVPYEGSVGLVNMLTCTRINRKGFDTSLVLYGPGVLMASATRGFPTVGAEAFPGHMGYNNQLQTFMKEGGKVYACRFAMAALYGMRETDLIEGVIPFSPLDVLDANLTARREGALVMQTWTL
ncbi:MAG: MSMEG_0572 family nitrogen starvation response protein [Pseudonocardia sp.]|nr:MSMEG_0572 family nitrogen starvation response protein [Pseudonocardia sp.]